MKKSQKADAAAKKTKDVPEKLAKFRRWNIWLGAIYAAQAVAILVVSATKGLPVATSFLTSNTLASETAGETVLTTASRHLFDLNVTFLVAGFLLTAAVMHGLAATWLRRRYEMGLREGVNKVRWIENALTGGLAALAVALVSGVTELVLLFVVLDAAFIVAMMGVMHDRTVAANGRRSWVVCIAALLAGVLPLKIIGAHLIGAAWWGMGTIPVYTYWLYGTLLVAVAGFAVNVYLRYKKTGKWADYFYSERMYLLISLVATTALAWQVFAGALRP